MKDITAAKDPPFAGTTHNDAVAPPLPQTRDHGYMREGREDPLCSGVQAQTSTIAPPLVCSTCRTTITSVSVAFRSKAVHDNKEMYNSRCVQRREQESVAERSTDGTGTRLTLLESITLSPRRTTTIFTHSVSLSSYLSGGQLKRRLFNS